MTPGGMTTGGASGAATFATAAGLAAGAAFLAAAGACAGFGASGTGWSAAGTFVAAAFLAAGAGFASAVLFGTVFGKGAFCAGGACAAGRVGAVEVFLAGTVEVPRDGVAGAAFLRAAFLAGGAFLLEALVFRGVFLTADVLTGSPRDGASPSLAKRAEAKAPVLTAADCSHASGEKPDPLARASATQVRHCSRPCFRMSCGRSMPMKTILLCFFSPGIHFGPRSLPMSWWTPWKMTLRSAPFIWSTPL